jgi:FkbM family methyltransferase
MLIEKIKKRIKQVINNPDKFLKQCKGVIHVGANLGQERGVYKSFNLPVVWVEPIPDIFSQLQKNISNYPNQIAYNYLVADENNKDFTFKIASNRGASSSIFDFGEHKKLWPEVHYVNELHLKSITLPSLAEKEKIDVSKFDALIMDTQGSELLILKGSERLLSNFNFIKVEVPDFESYVGCVKFDDLTAWLKERGYEIFSKNNFKSKKGIGNYYDVVYKKSGVQTT